MFKVHRPSVLLAPLRSVQFSSVQFRSVQFTSSRPTSFSSVQFSSLLLSRAAEFGFQHLWQPMMAASRGKARGILTWKLRRKIGAAIVRANVMLLMDHVAHMGGGAAAAYSRQSRVESRFFRGPAEASHAHRQQRNAAPR